MNIKVDTLHICIYMTMNVIKIDTTFIPEKNILIHEYVWKLKYASFPTILHTLW